MKRIYVMTSSKPIIHPVYLFVLLSGMAALSWEAIWQIKSALALGVSAWGTALTLAITMGGMALGAIVTGYILRDKHIKRPLRIYAALEIMIGIFGLLLPLLFSLVRDLDTQVYATNPDQAFGVFVTGIVMALIGPAFCMGATLPVLGLMGRQFKVRLSVLYGLNTLGAATGVLLMAFAFIPMLGITGAIYLVAAVNAGVAVFAWFMDNPEYEEEAKIKKAAEAKESMLDFKTAAFLVFITGFVTFVLEVSWFRSLRAAFLSTSEAFAIMLACVLIALGLGARLAGFVRERGYNLGIILALAGILILLATPIVERFDLFVLTQAKSAFVVFVQWFGITLYTIGAPVLLLGIALPLILDDHATPKQWGILYGLNAFAAILGAIIAAWVLLPTFGLAQTAWLAGILIANAGLMVMPDKRRTVYLVSIVAALTIAVVFESGIGRERAQNTMNFDGGQPIAVLESFEGPDASVSVVDYANNQRVLYVDGFATTQQWNVEEGEKPPEHYMEWMGHLPMLLHPDPKTALVICFGTGQTANAVRNENPESLDIVDINENVYKLAHNFEKNEEVLKDPRVTPIVMDGRAYIRRTGKKYDVITLEPMPPTFAGVNALYSKDFYKEAYDAMTEDGVIAQWMPFHLVDAESSAAILRTFTSVFPNAILWMDPASLTGIIVGTKSKSPQIGTAFPGFERVDTKRSMSAGEVRESILMNADKIDDFAPPSKIITDDNQLLAYGKASYAIRERFVLQENVNWLSKADKNLQEMLLMQLDRSKKD